MKTFGRSVRVAKAAKTMQRDILYDFKAWNLVGEGNCSGLKECIEKI